MEGERKKDKHIQRKKKVMQSQSLSTFHRETNAQPVPKQRLHTQNTYPNHFYFIYLFSFFAEHNVI